MKLLFPPLFRPLAAAAALTSILAVRAGALSVTNGDFEDLTGLTPQGGGWYQGVPAGWTSTADNPTFAVIDSGFGNPPPTANLGTLSILRQNVGTTTSATPVTLKFDLGTFDGAPSVTVRITDGASVVYASGTFSSAANNQLLTAALVGAGQPVYIEFEKTGSANPWLDNVSVSASAFQPSLINGDFADVSGLTDIGDGWFAGVPAGWSTDAPSEIDYAYSVRQVGAVNYANLQILSVVSGGFFPLRQNIGTVDVTSNITVSFKAASLNGFPYVVGSAIYNAADDTRPLAVFSTPAVNGNTTVTYSALAVPAGTEVYIGFWTTTGLAPGITDVVVSTEAAAATLSLEPGATLAIDAEETLPRTSAGNVVFQPGATVTVSGTPTGSAVPLLSASGSISGAPVLASPVAGYALANTGSLLWLRPAGSPLALFNGDFNDLTGLTAQNFPWYAGVPLGWTFTNPANNTGFSVLDLETDPADWAANLAVLGIAYSGFNPLTQVAGTTESAGDVTLSFDVVKPINENRVAVGAAIFDAVSGSVLANITIDTETGPDTGSFSITAPGVAAGTSIRVGFWSALSPNLSGSYPFLDNVTISGGGAPPVYDTWAESYGLDPAGNGAPGADPDGDGWSNNSEFAFGTSPTVATPALVRTALVGGQAVLSWMQRIDSPSAYTVQETADLATGPWVPSAAPVQDGTGPVPPAGYAWKQISVVPAGKKFFRVTASL